MRVVLSEPVPVPAVWIHVKFKRDILLPQRLRKLEAVPHRRTASSSDVLHRNAGGPSVRACNSSDIAFRASSIAF